MQELFFLFQKRTVVSADAQQSIRIGAIEFCHLSRDIFKKVAVVADDYAGERCILKKGLKPLDSCQIEMVGGFVQQQDVRSLNQRFDDGQTLLPASRQCNRRGFKLVEAGAAKGFREASAPLGGRNGGALQRFLDYRANRVSRRKFRILQNTGEPDTL